jgi:predicted membrane-bound mannosyltransferase
MHWWRDGRPGWALAAGLGAGLMQATKSSAPLFVVAALAGLALVRPGRPASRHPLRDVSCALLTALLVAGLFQSSFGTNPRGLADALSTYASIGGRLATDTGQEKPWWYYLSLFGWRRDGGVVTQQVPFAALALAGCVVALVSKRHPLLRWAAAYSAGLALVLSFTAYKTPWHVIHLVPGFALLAAGGLAAGPGPIAGRFVAAGLALAVMTAQAQQVRLTSFQRPADERNPYAYVHTSPDVLKLRERIRSMPAGQLVRVISEEVWPLPWYLRGSPQVGYWTKVPDDCDGDLVIASAGIAAQVEARLHGRYATGYIGLRPGFTLVVFTRQP